MVLLDEAHHVPASTFRGILTYLRCRYRWGLTATPSRTDGLTKMLGYYIGPRLDTITQAETEAAGRTLPVTIVPVLTGHAYPKAARYEQLIDQTVADDNRTEKLADFTAAKARQGRMVVALALRTEFCDDLAARLVARGVAARSLHAKVKGRADILAGFKRRQISVLVATQLADEALDLPCADTMLLTMSSRSPGRNVQRSGRISRNAPGKSKPTVYDLIDDNKLAYSQWAARERAYKSAYGKDSVTEYESFSLIAEGDMECHATTTAR